MGEPKDSVDWNSPLDVQVKNSGHLFNAHDLPWGEEEKVGLPPGLIVNLSNLSTKHQLAHCTSKAFKTKSDSGCPNLVLEFAM